MQVTPLIWDAYQKGELSPIFFGTALNRFGVHEILDAFVDWALPPQPRQTDIRTVDPNEEKFSAFVFKIQANMDPSHHDRIAYARICSGSFKQRMKMYHVRQSRTVAVHNALTFMAGNRAQAEEAWPGDILGLHNHGTIQIGDTFTEGEALKFIGIPNFAPELFRSVRLKDPLRVKALQKGLIQLSEEGTMQVFRPLSSNDLIVGAIGSLQFDVVAYRLQYEYRVECCYEPVQIVAARWITSAHAKKLEEISPKGIRTVITGCR